MGKGFRLQRKKTHLALEGARAGVGSQYSTAILGRRVIRGYRHGAVSINSEYCRRHALLHLFLRERDVVRRPTYLELRVRKVEATQALTRALRYAKVSKETYIYGKETYYYSRT